MAQTQTRTVRIVSLAFVAVALLAGCMGSGTSPFVGVWGGDTSDPKQPSLELKSDGNATGTDGCNRLMGSWKEDGKTIAFGGGSPPPAWPAKASTRGCPTPPRQGFRKTES